MTSNTIQSFLIIPAACAFFYNDVLALISILGSVILFLGSFSNSPSKQLKSLAEWNSAPGPGNGERQRAARTVVE